MAELPSALTAFKPIVTTTEKKTLDLHGKGVAVETEDGYLQLRCMKHCQGFFCDLQLKKPICLKDEEELRRVGDATCEVILKIVPTWESEQRQGVFKFIMIKASTNSTTRQWKIILKREKEQPRKFQSILSSYLEQNAEDIESGVAKKAWVSAADALSRVEETRNWPKEAKNALLNRLEGDVQSPIFESGESNDFVSYYLVFKGTGEPWSTLEEKATNALCIFGYTEK